ncbi:uncharacterized protein PRCAT00002592001 [Priceomyces carsonii]|uniref:uncharacterized protein n=1 Tax=Priceomyces carsonii TaxID=28549 RepID=UPI002ED8D7C0|nr:unnamed protein product [Priceomyces carsonii]
MDKHNPLQPYAYDSSTNGGANSAHKTELVRKTDFKQEKCFLSFTPSLKRKMGESFNEKDNIKKREKDFDSDEGEDEKYDHKDVLQTEDDPPKGTLKQRLISNFPSSPPLDAQIPSEFGDCEEAFYIADSPTYLPSDDIINTSFLQSSVSFHQHRNPSSDADFGIDRFNRFKNPSINQCPSTDKDRDRIEEYESQQKSTLLKAKELVLEAFENIQPNINLEGMGLHDLPEEIKDFDKLVIFETEPISQISYQLYLTNNKLTDLPPSLFKFSKLNVLGLRQNKLTRIPPLVRKLRNMTDLYIGTNRLQYLPPEILDLPSLSTFRAGPNPYIKVHEDAIPICSSKNASSKRLKYISKLKWISMERSKVPSLKAICLNIIANYDVSYQETKNWKKSTPKLYHNSIIKAIAKGQYEETCSECDNIVVDPVAYSIEWWDFLLNREIPIRREFCSGKCAEKWEARTITNIDDS